MAECSQPKQLGAKVVLLGDTKVGKSCLFYRIKHKQFCGNSRGSDTMTDGPSYPMNQLTHNRGYDSCNRSFILESSNQQVNLTIMDSVHSHDRGQSLSAQFYKKLQAVILVCSLDNEQSLIHLAHWIDEATVYMKGTKDQRPVFVIAGTKSDIEENKRDVTYQMLQTFGNEHQGIPVFEVSAKTGEGITRMLRALAESVVDHAVRSGKLTTPSPGRKGIESTPLLDSSRQSSVALDNTFIGTRDVDDSCCPFRSPCGCTIL